MLLLRVQLARPNVREGAQALSRTLSSCTEGPRSPSVRSPRADRECTADDRHGVHRRNALPDELLSSHVTLVSGNTVGAKENKRRFAVVGGDRPAGVHSRGATGCGVDYAGSPQANSTWVEHVPGRRWQILARARGVAAQHAVAADPAICGEGSRRHPVSGGDEWTPVRRRAEPHSLGAHRGDRVARVVCQKSIASSCDTPVVEFDRPAQWLAALIGAFPLAGRTACSAAERPSHASRSSVRRCRPAPKTTPPSTPLPVPRPATSGDDSGRLSGEINLEVWLVVGCLEALLRGASLPPSGCPCEGPSPSRGSSTSARPVGTRLDTSLQFLCSAISVEIDGRADHRRVRDLPARLSPGSSRDRSADDQGRLRRDRLGGGSGRSVSSRCLSRQASPRISRRWQC
jgi:hypothetical protein